MAVPIEFKPVPPEVVDKAVFKVNAPVIKAVPSTDKPVPVLIKPATDIPEPALIWPEKVDMPATDIPDPTLRVLEI